MQTEKQNTQLKKFVIILVAVLFFALIGTALVQTFVIKSLNNKQAALQQQNQQVLDQIQDTQNELDIRKSDGFADEALKPDGYGTSEDIIIKQS